MTESFSEMTPSYVNHDESTTKQNQTIENLISTAVDFNTIKQVFFLVGRQLFIHHNPRRGKLRLPHHTTN